MENQDKLVQDLFKVVQDKKAEIAQLEKPNWITNCSFRYSKDTAASINLHTVSDVEELVHILAFLIGKERDFDSAQAELGTSIDFKWLGYTVKEWKTDIQTKINKIQISKKKKELELVEGRLDKLISPELKRKMELEEIQKLLS